MQVSMPQRKTIHSFYDITHSLGKGSFATVKYATRKADEMPVAIKIIKKAAMKDSLSSLAREVSILKACNHIGIIKLFELYESKSKVYLVMELATGGELFDKIVARGHYSEEDARETMQQVVSAISYLHGRDIVHRDLKPENLLLEDDSRDAPVKVADFGLGYMLSDGECLATCCGTAGYTAPEVLLSEPYGTEPDIYSLGVILYVLLVGFPPFDDRDMEKMVADVVRGKWGFPAPYWNDISDEAKDLVKRMMERDPRKRINAVDVMKHPWMKVQQSQVHLKATQDQMKKYLAKLRLK
ncbi:calcium/calmodulin-dependent/calcium-dependent protein kinase, partial [Kipferlia bialata]|eukprot:g9779.t1